MKSYHTLIACALFLRQLGKAGLAEQVVGSGTPVGERIVIQRLIVAGKAIQVAVVARTGADGLYVSKGTIANDAGGHLLVSLCLTHTTEGFDVEQKCILFKRRKQQKKKQPTWSRTT
jgi:hypothetical protein